MKKLVRYIGYAVVIFFLFALTMATVPYSLGGWAALFIIRPIWRRHHARTADEREMMGYAKAQARDEAERIRLQVKIDAVQEKIILKAKQDAGLVPVKKGFAARFAHGVGNVGRDLILEKRKPFDPYKYKK